MFTRSEAQVYSCAQSGCHARRCAHTRRQVPWVVLAVWWTAVCRSLPHELGAIVATFPGLSPGCIAGHGRAHIRGQLQATIHQLLPPPQKLKLLILEDVQTREDCAAWLCWGCGSSQTQIVPKGAHNSQQLAPNVYVPTLSPAQHSRHKPLCQTPVPPPLLAVSRQLSPPQSLEAIWDLTGKPFIQRLFLRATVNTVNISCQQNTLSAANGFFPDFSKQSFL